MRRSVIPYLIMINVAVFLIWNFSTERSFNWMVLNFLVSWDSLTEGRVWTLLTSVFSHNMFLHIFINMFVLQNFGTVVERLLGSWRFLKFYVIAGIFSSFCHAFVSAWLLGEPSLPALGASGAISALILVFALVYKKEKVYIFGLLPLPALMGAIAFIGLDLWGLVAQAEGGGLPIGHGAHLGGALAGFIYYFFFLRKKLRYVSQ